LYRSRIIAGYHSCSRHEAAFGRPGVAPGEFYVLHHMNVDSKGNLYVTEVQDGKRTQKFVYKGTLMK
jgi:hypothetical protein